MEFGIVIINHLLRTFMILPLTIACFLFLGATAVAGDAARAAEEVVLAVAPYLPATELVGRFDPLARYLSGRIGRPVRVEVSPGYEAQIRRIGKNEADVAFLGSASFVLMTERYGEKPILARMEVRGRASFHGYIAVRRDSPVSGLAGLAGKRMAFGDPHSTTGFLVPRSMLHQAGVPLRSLAGWEHLVSHNDVVLGVLMGTFDAGAVKDEVFEAYRDRGLRALAQSPPISEYLFVTRSTLPLATVVALREAMLGLKDASILQAVRPGLSGLVPAASKDYDGLRAILAMADADRREEPR